MAAILQMLFSNVQYWQKFSAHLSFFLYWMKFVPMGPGFCDCEVQKCVQKMYSFMKWLNSNIWGPVLSFNAS